jgi:uncharacterized delta-60 repeat protein
MSRVIGKWFVVGCMTALALVVAAAPVQAAPNGLDSTFGGDGKVTTDFAGAPDRGRAVAIQPDGKLMVAGETVVPRPGYPGFVQFDFALARYHADGTLDTTFDGDGKVNTDFGSTCALEGAFCGDDLAQAVALQPDGKIVVAGWTVIASVQPDPKTAFDTDFALARYNADGTLDTTFGGDGKVTTDIGRTPDPLSLSRDSATSVGIQADGRIVAAGWTVTETSGSALVRYNADGTLDPSFNGDGIVTTADNALANGLALQADGRIVVAGAAADTADFALARYTADGALDHTFGGDGKVSTDFADGSDDAANAVAIQADGKIVAAGTGLNGGHGAGGGDFALARYNVDGTLDPSFGGDGKVTTDFLDTDGARAVAIQPDGRIVAAGGAGARTTLAGGFALARYNADGTLDANGGDDGKTITEFGGDARPSAEGMAIQPDGRIVLAGSTGFIPCSCFDSDFALARYKAAGSWRLDPPGHREVNPCVNGSFVDLNAVFGVPEQFVCGATINAGEPWRPLAFWFVGPAYFAAPPGYIPAAETPLEDLVSKLDAVKVVVDAGTKQQSTTVFSPARALRTDVTLDQFDPEAPPFPMAVTLPSMKPLKVGEHTVEVVWVLDEMHCDGLGESPADNCLPAGDVSFGRRVVTVAAP